MKCLRAAVVTVVLVLSPLSVPAHSAPPGKPVTVMSRNLYLGADIQRPVNAAVAETSPDLVGLLAVRPRGSGAAAAWSLTGLAI